MSETSELPSTRTWDGAASAPVSKRVARFEAAWNAARSPSSRPVVEAFLPDKEDERPAALLALLRAELALRYEAGEAPRLEAYAESRPDLDEDGLVALIYEDFCLREEAGDAPTPVEYEERFPELTHRLGRVFDIHDLVGSAPSLSMPQSSTPRPDFPEVGQTIGGFHLRDELGRGSFARVFLAEERQLADRPVALKVARTGSREPQTLARLQHTHIVPVYSYRIDRATGLHLLCMPYFGRVTLERLLDQPAMKTARTGADVLAALDRLESTPGRSVPTRTAFGQLPYARAVAWWGARMAEALAHAHDRGVMHRDVKPSNVLVTGDGLPMLLDFNLAREPFDPDRAEDPGSLGGTLAYMSPEHLDAVADGSDDQVDGRADLFSLGVLLFETLTSRRPFGPPRPGASVGDTLRRAAADRRGAVPSIRDAFPEIPAALESIILRCLEPEPDRRHRNASELAADLDAVVAEAPLPHTREPMAGRAKRWAARHRFGLTLTLPLLVLSYLLVNDAGQAREDQTRIARRVERLVGEGEALERRGAAEAALAKYEDAANLAADQPYYLAQPPLAAGHRKATDRRLGLALAHRTAENVARFLEEVDRLKGRPPRAEAMDRLLAGFERIAVRPGWTADPLFRLLPPATARTLEREHEELLLRRVLLALAEDDVERAGELARRGAAASARPDVWSAALSARFVGSDGGEDVDRLLAAVDEAGGRRGEAIARLERVLSREPGDFWCRRRLAGLLEREGRIDGALAQLDFALALRPGAADVREDRDRLARLAKP